MKHRFFRLPLRPALFAALLGLLLFTAPAPADPVPGDRDRLVTRMVTAFLHEGHLARPEIGDDLSRRLFGRLFKGLDPMKLYFLKGDLADFKKFETELDDQLQRGDLRFAYAVFARFLQTGQVSTR